MNVGQILETHLGWAAAGGWYDDDTEAYKNAHAKGGDRRVFVATPVFDGAGSRTSTRRSCAGRPHLEGGRSGWTSTSPAARASAPRAR